MLTVENLGTRLRDIRKARLMTQEQLHERAGVAVSTIVAIEHGKQFPRGETLRKLAEALGVTPEWLVIGRDV
jgi:transcriptional regulator with XRE-family HTH domain